MDKVRHIFAHILLVLALGLQAVVSAAPVSEVEALRTADLWRAMELNSGRLTIAPTRKAAKLASISARKVLYMISRDDVVEKRPGNSRVLAYVVVYESGGYVIVSGDDRIEPVIAFDVEAPFWWDQPDINGPREYLGRTMTQRWKRVQESEARGQKLKVHGNWSKLRAKAKEAPAVETANYGILAGTVTLRWNTPLWSQGQFYNAVVVAANGGIAGIPTGCTATAMAIKWKFHAWPIVGNGEQSYDDTEGDVQYSHYVNFGARTYNWDQMPMASLTQANGDVANLMYDCGVAVYTDYEVGWSGAWPVTPEMDFHFRYYGTRLQSGGDYYPPLIDSIRSGLPTIICTSVHTMVATGYRDTMSPWIYINAGHDGGGNGWYNLDSLPASDPVIEYNCPYSSPNIYTYVDPTYPGPGIGSRIEPYNTVPAGAANVASGGRLWLAPATFTGAGNVPVTFGKPMTISAYAGTATIGDRIRLPSYEADGIDYRSLNVIKISGNGMLKVD